MFDPEVFANKPQLRPELGRPLQWVVLYKCYPLDKQRVPCPKQSRVGSWNSDLARED
jgi:hypothetical protein